MMPSDIPPFRDHFSADAADYARYRPQYPMALVEDLASLAPRRKLAWDVGCGSGQLSRLLARRFERVVATDASPQQIALARETESPSLEFRVARAEASGLPGRSVDLVTAAQAAHWFDQEAFHAEVRRVCRPGGVIALLSYGLFQCAPAVDQVVGRLYREVLGSHWPAERRHVEEGYLSLPFPYEELAAPDFEHWVEWSREQLLGYIRTWSAVRSLLAAGGEDALARFERELAEAWEEGSGSAPPSREIRWPLVIRLGRV